MPLYYEDGHLPILERRIVVQEHLSITSTQLLARNLLQHSHRPFPAFAITAREQSSGSGRRGSNWESPIGGSYQTIMLQDAEQRLRTGSLTLLIAATIASKLNEAYDSDIMVKWPNDLYLYGKKVGGILTEWSKGHLIVGVGVNVVIPTLRTGATLGLTDEDIAEVTNKVREAILIATARAWDGRGFEANDMAHLDYLKGRSIVANLFKSGSGMLHGVAKGVDSSGRLLITDLHGTDHRVLNASIVQH